jgi:hypothetical protein
MTDVAACLSTEGHAALDLRHLRIEYQFEMVDADRCYALLRAAGDLWAWLIDCNRQRRQQNTAPVVGYQALCRELTGMSGLGELSVAGARSVVQRYSVAWFEAERRRRAGAAGGFPRRKRALMPIRFYNGRFKARRSTARAASCRIWLPGAVGEAGPVAALSG